MAAGKFADAGEKFDKLLKQYPDEPQLLQVAGLAALRLRDTETALIPREEGRGAGSG